MCKLDSDKQSTGCRDAGENKDSTEWNWDIKDSSNGEGKVSKLLKM